MQKVSSKKKGVYYRYHSMCKSCTLDERRRYKSENYEKVLEQKRRTFEKNREKENNTVRNWRKRNREHIKEYHDNYREQNQEKFMGYNINRSNKNHRITNKEWLACKLYFNNSCAYCGLHIDNHYIIYAGESKHTDLHKEHAIHDGSDDLSNCIPSCKSCNSRKSTYSFIEWFNSNHKPIEFNEEKLKLINRWLDEDYELYMES
jgi:hypothetical protein